MDRLPQQKGWFYALGYALPHLNPEDAWDAEAERGRQELAKTLHVRLESGQWWVGWDYGKWLKEEVSKEVIQLVELRGAQTLERYYDLEETLYYVLIGLKRDLVLDQLRQRWQQALQSLQQQMESSVSIQKQAEVAFKKLEAAIKKEEQP